MNNTKEFVNYYVVLGVAKNADDKTLKTAYRKLSLKVHPDKRPGDPQASEEFIRLKEAYDNLIDGSLRRQFDSRLATHEQQQKPAEQQWREPKTHQSQQGRQSWNKDPTGGFEKRRSNFEEEWAKAKHCWERTPPREGEGKQQQEQQQPSWFASGGGFDPFTSNFNAAPPPPEDFFPRPSGFSAGNNNPSGSSSYANPLNPNQTNSGKPSGSASSPFAYGYANPLNPDYQSNPGSSTSSSSNYENPQNPGHASREKWDPPHDTVFAESCQARDANEKSNFHQHQHIHKYTKPGQSVRCGCANPPRTYCLCRRCLAGYRKDMEMAIDTLQEVGRRLEQLIDRGDLLAARLPPGCAGPNTGFGLRAWVDVGAAKQRVDGAAEQIHTFIHTNFAVSPVQFGFGRQAKDAPCKFCTAPFSEEALGEIEGLVCLLQGDMGTRGGDLGRNPSGRTTGWVDASAEVLFLLEGVLQNMPVQPDVWWQKYEEAMAWFKVPSRSKGTRP